MSSVEGRGADRDQSVSRTSRRFEERTPSIASRNVMRTSHARNRARSRNRSNRRYARSNASCATSSASAPLRSTPRATRYASGPHSASRSSNSRRNAAAAASCANSFSALRPGWISASSCIGSFLRAESARPPRTPARRHGKRFGSRKFIVLSYLTDWLNTMPLEIAPALPRNQSRFGTTPRGPSSVWGGPKAHFRTLALHTSRGAILLSNLNILFSVIYATRLRTPQFAVVHSPPSLFAGPSPAFWRACGLLSRKSKQNRVAAFQPPPAN